MICVSITVYDDKDDKTLYFGESTGVSLELLEYVCDMLRDNAMKALDLETTTDRVMAKLKGK